MPRNKYGAVRTIVDNITLDSKREAARYSELRLLERAGKITNLELQPEFPLIIDGRTVKIKDKNGHGRSVKAIMDFAYFDLDLGKRVIVDVKGCDTDYSRLKRALVECIYGVTVTVERTK